MASANPVAVDGPQATSRLLSSAICVVQNLPAILAALPSAKVEQTHEGRNYVRFVTVDPDQPRYGVFFTLKRNREEGHHLSLFVESAYCDPDPNPTAGQVRFKVLAAKVFQNQPISFKGRR